MSDNSGGVPGHAAKLMQIMGSLVYAIFLVAVWIVGLAALGAAVISYMIGAMEPVAGAVGVLAGTSIVYVVVANFVRRTRPVPQAALENEPIQ